MIGGGFTRGNPNPHWHSIDTLSDGVGAPHVTPNSGTLTAANLAIYIPLLVRARAVVKQLWFASSTTGAGNYDLGLYDAAGTALLRKGSTAKPAAAALQVWDCTDTTIDKGIYYVALVSDSGTDTFFRCVISAPYGGALGIWTESSSFPLPATATFAVANTLTVIPVAGLFLDTRVT